MSSKHHVLLIPGFFGFESFGGLRYFVSVKEVIERFFAESELDVEVLEVSTSPTASIRRRAAKVLETVAAVAQENQGDIHLIGHSTGGLDARLAITPTASLPTDVVFTDYERVKTLVTVATPHYGTPSASFFGTFMGKPLLRVLALALGYTIRFGRLPISVALSLAKLVTKADDLIGSRETALDKIFSQLLGSLPAERRRVLADFLTEVAEDQSLVFQLTPEGLDLFNATTLNPKGLRCASVVTRGARPSVATMLAYRGDVYATSMHVVYMLLYQLASRMPRSRLPGLRGGQGNALIARLGKLPRVKDNDGFVPTLSQVWGEVIVATQADHFDVIGHFSNPLSSLPHIDWIPSGSKFDRGIFEDTWRDVVKFIVAG